MNIETGTAIKLTVYFTDCLYKGYRSSGLPHERQERADDTYMMVRVSLLCACVCTHRRGSTRRGVVRVTRRTKSKTSVCAVFIIPAVRGRTQVLGWFIF